MLAIPLFIRYLGIEAYGLIGFYLLLISSAQLVELGLGTAVARRIAQLREHNAPAAVIRAVAAGIGLRYGLVVIAIALSIFGPLRPLLVHYVHARSLSNNLISQAIAMMGIAIVGHLAVNYLTNLMLGLEKHFMVSGLRFIQVGLLQLLSALVLMAYPGIETYFLVQIVGVALLVLCSLAINLRYFRALPKGDPTSNGESGLGGKITAGIATITLLGFVFSQIDRIVLSGSVSLSDFGYYSLAFSVINAVNVLVAPTFNVLMPVFSRSAVGSRTQLWNSYRQTYRINQALLIPAIAVLVFLPTQALWAWTGDSKIISICPPIIQLLAIGALAQGLTNASWLTQLGLGKTRAEIVFHSGLVLMTPMGLLIGLHFWGLPGAALAVASAHVLHLICSSIYVGTYIFKQQLSGSLKSTAAWLLAVPAGLIAWGAPEHTGRILSGIIVVTAYGIPALAGLLWASGLLTSIKTAPINRNAVPERL